MSNNRPASERDGPVRFVPTNGKTEEWDRVFHSQGGIKLYNVIRSGNRIMKGDEAKFVPYHRVEEIEYLGYG